MAVGSESARRVALLIDCENESAARAERILEVAASIGRVVQVNAYADWTRPEAASWAKACKRHGIRQVVVNRTPCGKNTVDNYMSADAARLAESTDIDAVCLVTSDSDFSGAATVVRAAGKEVYGIGSASGEFAATCTDFFQLSKEGGSWARGQTARVEPPPMPPARSEPSAHREAGAAGTRRCIGIDLAWGERNPTGCVELVWDGGELVLTRLALNRSIREIVEWIEPDRGDWIVAIDAPLIIRNQTGRRPAEADADRYYRRYHAGAYPSSLDKFGEGHRGGRLWRALEGRGGGLLEQPNMLGRPRLVFETYPHIVMVELFHLDRTIKYKARPGRDVVAGQRQLVNAIREHFCGGAASPRLRSNDALEELLREPRTPISDRALKDREELLDGLVGAYMAAWVDAGRPLQGLGNVGEGVMVVPSVRGIGARAAAVGSSGTAAASRARQPSAPSSQSRAPASPVAPAEARTTTAPRAEGGVLAALRKEPDGSAAAVKPQGQPRQDAGDKGRRGGRAGTRRLIGVALARGEKGASGCAELGWQGGELVLKRVALVRTVDEIAAGFGRIGAIGSWRRARRWWCATRRDGARRTSGRGGCTGATGPTRPPPI